MKTCLNCGGSIPARVEVDGITRILSSRKFCLSCSPFGTHNTRDIRDPKKRRDKMSLYVTQARQRTKQKAVEYKGGCCIVCGYSKSVSALCFHHRDPDQKDFGVSAVTKAWNTVKSELDKCDLLCLNCHAEVHEMLRLGLED